MKNLLGISISLVHLLLLGSLGCQKKENGGVPQTKSSVTQECRGGVTDNRIGAVKEAKLLRYTHGISLAESVLDAGDPYIAERHVEELDPQLRGWEWNSMARRIESAEPAIHAMGSGKMILAHFNANDLFVISLDGRFFGAADRTRLTAMIRGMRKRWF
jgi:hypothetical protein